MFKVFNYFPEGGSLLNTPLNTPKCSGYSWILRLNTLNASMIMNTPAEYSAWILCFFHFQGFISSLHFFVEIILVNFWKIFIFWPNWIYTPPEYPEYSSRAFPLNTPGDPPSPTFLRFLCRFLWCSLLSFRWWKGSGSWMRDQYTS